MERVSGMTRGAEDRERWEELYSSHARANRPPSSWVLRTVSGLPNDLPLVDIAGGMGRHLFGDKLENRKIAKGWRPKNNVKGDRAKVLGQHYLPVGDGCSG